MFSRLIVFVSISLPLVLAQSAVWGQCGGIGWGGATTCVSGSVCTYVNDWYSQCIPGTATTPPPSGPTTTPTTTPGGPTQTVVPGARLYLAGDSTTAPDTGTAYAGWGTQIGKYLSIPVTNNAIPGKSSRSFTDQGYFSGMYNNVKANDLVIIEFGHNEGGGPAGNPQQGVCPGTSLTTTCNDNGKVVYTYFKYMTDAINSFKAKGAIVIVASQTTRNPFNNPGATPIFVDYARQVASQTGVPFVDHYSILLRQFNAMGAGAVNALYPVDNIHTNSQGADYAAQALLRGVLCASNNPLAPYISNRNVVPASC